jgi:hypothetical protein
VADLDAAGGFFIKLGSRVAPDEGPGSPPSRKPKKRRPLQPVPVILCLRLINIAKDCTLAADKAALSVRSDALKL